MTGELTAEDLMISKILRKPLNKYNSLFPHVTDGLQLEANGRLLRKGDTVDYIFKDADHINPLCRTVPLDMTDRSKSLSYGREKYRDLLLDAAEMILSNFWLLIQNSSTTTSELKVTIGPTCRTRKEGGKSFGDRIRKMARYKCKWGSIFDSLIDYEAQERRM